MTMFFYFPHGLRLGPKEERDPDEEEQLGECDEGDEGRANDLRESRTSSDGDASGVAD